MNHRILHIKSGKIYYNKSFPPKKIRFMFENDIYTSHLICFRYTIKVEF